jgi:hypothetical protein
MGTNHQDNKAVLGLDFAPESAQSFVLRECEPSDPSRVAAIFLAEAKKYCPLCADLPTSKQIECFKRAVQIPVGRIDASRLPQLLSTASLHVRACRRALAASSAHRAGQLYYVCITPRSPLVLTRDASAAWKLRHWNCSSCGAGNHPVSPDSSSCQCKACGQMQYIGQTDFHLWTELVNRISTPVATWGKTALVGASTELVDSICFRCPLEPIRKYRRICK